ncbi:hypothetical protein [Catellatospora citrea]|uniref:Uncharacterized protein n=1 Tax=Catellatospora citrea TaxID=53366 RepID=A0A8J3KG37_9ACTN|nr:hypothetical protein [Catellatospora citrea]RKE10413.1 hypothetical protein C8E86_5309 [Catellatospora citrea]GIF99082.1 hypothetical protein Cci01nite_41760 [Catellatospora citrea]
MGISYQNLLLIGEMSQVRQAVTAAGADGWLVPAGPGRVALLPREGRCDVADVAVPAERLSTALGTPVLTNELIDSDVVVMTVYQDGRAVHRYVSDEAMLVDWFIDDDGVAMFRIGDVEYPADAAHPTGPSGADPQALARFGVGATDRARLAAVLRGESGHGERLRADEQHHLILELLHLDPGVLTMACRWFPGEDRADAVRVPPVPR